MTSRRRSVARNIDRLNDSERSAVLSILLSAHPELLVEADALAAESLVAVDPDVVAENVMSALRELDMEDLANRAGRHRGGYVEPNEAAWDLVEEAFEPFLLDLRRLAELSHVDAATAAARGLLNGLHRIGEPADGTVLAWAGPDTVDHLADAVRLDAEKLGLPVDGGRS